MLRIVLVAVLVAGCAAQPTPTVAPTPTLAPSPTPAATASGVERLLVVDHIRSAITLITSAERDLEDADLRSTAFDWAAAEAAWMTDNVDESDIRDVPAFNAYALAVVAVFDALDAGEDIRPPIRDLAKLGPALEALR